MSFLERLSCPEWRCAECHRLARQFQDAWHADQQDVRAHLHKTAQASGREPEIFLREWVMSLAAMPDDEFESLQSARYPRVENVRRTWKEHEARSGHGGPRDGWRGAFIFDVVVGAGYFGFRAGRSAP
jgi:hypothetical protein